MQEKYDSIIFDLDGTLWDSTAACAESWNSAVSQLKVQARRFEPSDISSIMGMPHKKIYEKMFPALNDSERAKVARTCYEEEIKLIDKIGSPLYPGVKEGLIELSQKYPLYLLSNCLIEYLDTFLKVTGFGPLFKDAFCHGHTMKPKAHNMRLLVEKHKLAKPVYVGDTSSDQLSSIEAGVDYLHVEYGFGQPHAPCKTFKSFAELVEFFKK